MPYFDIPGHEGQAVTRVTEALASEYRAWLDKNHPKKHNRSRRIDHSSVRGTSVHNKIEDYICLRENIPQRTRKERDPFELQIIMEDMQKPYHEQILAPVIKRCFVNFLKYWTLLKRRYMTEILMVEVRVFSEKYLVGGTVDILMKIFVNGLWYLAVLDWKSGRFFTPTYGYQSSAYREFISEMKERGDIMLPELEWYPKNFIVLLGDSQPIEHQLPHDFEGYLTYLKRYRNPKKQCTSKSCVYCPDIQRCPFISEKLREKYSRRLGYFPALEK